jgi:hypothetical protein
VPRAAAVRLRQDRLGDVRESGTVHAGAVRVCAIPSIEQRGKADHQVNPGGTGSKWLEGGEASSALGVEKHAARSDAPESWHKKIARFADWRHDVRLLPEMCAESRCG